jgi:glycosyltransferase involved in cell wall biosynthesis
MTTATAPRFSMVIPAFNEARWLPPLLDTVDRARAACSHGPDAVEVIVADNASTDRTAEIAASRGCRVARVENRTIAAARNGGARLARGEILLFVDADSRIHPGTFDTVDAALATGKFVAGASGVTSERWSLGIVATWAFMIPMVWLTGMDTGVVFCRREDYAAVGGYDETRRVAEDVKVLVALRRLGRGRGQRLVRLRGVKTVASTRKFDEHGDWHYFTSMLTLVLAYVVHPRSAARRIERYWYEPDR